MAEYTLEELAERTGISARTIRSYIEKGLLPGPGQTGPKARYGDQHLEKLRNILHLKDVRSLKLDDIRQLLFTVSDAALSEVRKKEQLHGDELSDVRSALDYIRRVASHDAKPRRSRPAPAPDTGPLRDLLDGLKHLVGSRKVPQRARAESWRRIEVTPDIEIHIRGGLPPRETRQVERIADHLRTLLLGG